MTTNIISEYSGNPIVNQMVHYNKNKITFQSYRTLMCQIRANHRPTLIPNWQISTTTSKYLYMFLRQNGYNVKCKRDLEKMIDEKRFRLAEIKNV